MIPPSRCRFERVAQRVLLVLGHDTFFFLPHRDQATNKTDRQRSYPTSIFGNGYSLIPAVVTHQQSWQKMKNEVDKLGVFLTACLHQRRILFGLVILLILLLHDYVRMISTVAYTYLYWIHPRVRFVSEETKKPATGVDSVVPKLLHQTWKDKNVPTKWRKAQQSCIDHHKDYTYKLWTDEEGEALIRNEYPWFLRTYLSYPYDIQRVDAVRYFILHKYGGIYIDLDVGCNRNLEFMRNAEFTAPLTYPVGISNDIMSAAPGSRFLERAIHRLEFWNHWLFIKYIQVMFGTGPMFLTTQYASGSSKVTKGVGVIPSSLYGKYDFSGDPAFYHLHGSSWHADDAAFIFLLDTHKYTIILGCTFVSILGIIWHSMHRARRSRYVRELPLLTTQFSSVKQDIE